MQLLSCHAWELLWILSTIARLRFLHAYLFRLFAICWKFSIKHYSRSQHTQQQPSQKRFEFCGGFQLILHRGTESNAHLSSAQHKEEKIEIPSWKSSFHKSNETFIPTVVLWCFVVARYSRFSVICKNLIFAAALGMFRIQTSFKLLPISLEAHKSFGSW